MSAAWVDYDAHARTRPRTDFWGQVRRTVHGRPVDEGQIGMIVEAASRLLRLRPEDHLLDIACGNGALSHRLFARCAGGVGVDVSPYLIGVADEHFAGPRSRFAVADAARYAELADPGLITAAVCYGSFSYLGDDTAWRLLRALHWRFPGVSRVLLGNLPDPARAAAFYGPGPLPDLHEPRSAIGAWRSPAAVSALAGPGWRCSAHAMPPAFFAAHYRFDLLLERA